MRNKKLALLSLVLAILATFSLSALAACSNSQSSGSGSSSSGSSSGSSSSSSSGSSSGSSSSNPVEDEISITLPDTATVVEYETVTLTPTVVGEGDIVWSTSNDAVATVNDGVVYGVKAGEATVTAAIGEKTASCTVTVTATPYFHELVLSSNQASMRVGDTTEEITVSVTFNGEPLTVDGLEYTWAPVGDAATVASVSSEDNGATVTFTGLNVGDVEYTVSATVRGYLVSKNISVKVLDNVVTLEPTNESLVDVEGGYAASLVLGSDDTKSLTIGDVNVLKDGTSQGAADIAWAADDSGVVSVANGVVTALKAGTAVLTGSVTFEEKDLTVTLTVTVTKGTATLENTVTVETSTSKINVPAGVVGNVEKITIGSCVITASDISVSGGELTVADGKMPVNMQDLGENKTVVFETAEIVYTVPANVYTMIIDTKAEFDSWQEVACDVAVADGLCSVVEGKTLRGEFLSGYFVLNADIAYGGAYTPKVTYATHGTLYNWERDWGNGANFGFKGVFDGKGHTVSGMIVSGKYNAFVTTLSGCTIKNVSFVNAGVADGANFIAAGGTGTIENVYVKYSKISNSTADCVGTIYCNYQPITRVTKNLVIDITDCAFDKTIEKTLIVGYDFGTFENVVVIGEVPGGAILVGVDTEHDGLCLQADSYADLLASTEGAAAAEALTEGGFFTSGESIILPAGIMTKHSSDIPALAEDTETSIEIGSQLTLSGTEYCTYSLVGEVTGVTLNGKTVSVGSNATVGAQIVVKATSLVSGEESEFTFTVAAKSYVLGTQIDTDQVTLGALPSTFGLATIWNKSIENAAIDGATGKVAKFRNNEAGMNSHGSAVTFNEPLSVQSGLNFVKLRTYAKVESGTLASLSLRFYRSDRTNHQVETDVWMDASANIATNEWVNVYLDVTKFAVGGKVSGFQFGVFTAGDVTLYIDYISGETNAYTIGEQIDCDKLTVGSAQNFSLSGIWNVSKNDAPVDGIEGASGKVAKFVNSGTSDIKHHAGNVSLNNELTVVTGMNFIKVRFYVVSSGTADVTFRFFRADRADHNTADTSINIPVNAWTDVYLEVSKFTVDGKISSFKFASFSDGATCIYIDYVSVEVNSYALGTEANWSAINLTGAPSGFGLSNLSCEKVEASTVEAIAATASGKVAKFTTGGNSIQYHAGFVKFQTPVTVVEGYNYVKVRLYAVSSGSDMIGFRVYKTDRPAHDVESGSYTNAYNETVTTARYYNAAWESVAVNQWVDLYLDVAAFKVSTTFEGFGFMCDRAGVSAVYIDSISIVSTNA